MSGVARASFIEFLALATRIHSEARAIEAQHAHASDFRAGSESSISVPFQLGELTGDEGVREDSSFGDQLRARKSVALGVGRSSAMVTIADDGR